MDRIKVLIADDHVLVREGLRALLEAQPDIQVVGEADSGEEAVKKVKEARPDIVLMDITMPGMDGLEATARIKRDSPGVDVLILTMHESDGFFFKSLEAGASGYFIKGGSSRELISALHAVHQGDVFLHPSVAKKLLASYLQQVKAGQNKEKYDGLTNREREILTLVARGLTNQEIAERLVLSVATVQTHRANMMAKLGLRGRTELVKYAIRQGFITLDT